MKLHLPRGLRTALLACLNVTFASLAALGGMAFADTAETLNSTLAGLLSTQGYAAGDSYTLSLTMAEVSTDSQRSLFKFADNYYLHTQQGQYAGLTQGISGVDGGWVAPTVPSTEATKRNEWHMTDEVLLSWISRNATGADSQAVTLNGSQLTVTYDASSNTTVLDLLVANWGVTESVTLAGTSFDANTFAVQEGVTNGTGLTFTSSKASALYWGNNARSGDWDLTSTKWASKDGDAASSPFTNEMDAHFTEAGGGGTITVKGGIIAQNLSVEGKIPYTFELGSGSLTVSDSLNVGNSATAIFNMDLSVKAVTVDQAGQLGMGDSKTLTTDSITMLQESALCGPGVFKPAAVVLDVATSDKTLQPAVKGGAVLDTPSISGTGVLHVKGSTLRASQNTVVSDVELQAEGTTAARLEILEGKTMTVNKMAVEDTEVDNNGELLVTSGVIIKSRDGVDMGVLNVNGLMQVDGASTVVMHEGSIGMLTLTSDDTNLICETDLRLGSTTSDKGNLRVDGGLTVTGDVELGKVDAGSLTITSSPLAALTVSGQLTADSVTLQHLTTTTPCLTAGSLGTGTTTFVVAPEVLQSLDVEDGDMVVLADLNNPFADSASLTINGGSYWMNEDKGLFLFIGQDEKSHDIVLTVSAADYIWTNGTTDEYWGTGGNWQGLKVPDENAHAFVLGAEDPWTIVMDDNGKAHTLTFQAGSDSALKGEHSLTVYNSLDVEANAKVTIEDDVAVNATNILLNGELALLDDVVVDAGTIQVNGELAAADNAVVGAGTIQVNGDMSLTEGATMSAETLVLNGELALQQNPSSVEAGATVMRLNGAAGAKLTGPNPLLITGQGGVYAGGYDSAIVHLQDGAQASLAAGDGLSLIADSGSRATLTYIGATSVDTIQGDGMNLILNGTGAANNKKPLTISASSGAYLTNSIIVSGLSAKDTALTLGTGHAVVLDAPSLDLNGSTVQIYQTETDERAMKLRDTTERKGVKLVRFGAEDSSTDKVQLNGNLFKKYYENARLVNGWILVDLKDIHFSGITSAHTYNGISGAAMINDAFDQLDPQAMNPEGDLATVMDALEAEQVPVADQDRLAAAMAGASFAAMGAAFSKDVERQLRSIRNRTTSMGCDECVVNEDMPYVNCWVNAEGEFRRLKAENTLAGYKLNSWGGTVGVDVDFTNRFTAGVAFTYMNGDFTSCSADQASGDLDRYYVSLFARYNHRAWTHTLVGTFGWADTSLDRTVNYAGGSYRTTGGSNGSAFGLLYEVGYTWALNESATTCLQPIANVMFRHSNLGGYNESGSDAALSYGDSDSDVVTFGLGARLQRAAGSTFYNRTTLWEGRLLFKADAGERSSYSNARFLGVQGSRSIKSARYGACGLEIGAGVIIPVGSDADSLFFDVSAEFRGSYSEVNGVFGYRVNF